MLLAALATLCLPEAGHPREIAGQESPGTPDEAEAPIALLMDADNGQILFSREPQRRFVPASITKVMTTYVACNMLNDGRLHLNQVFTVSDNAYENWSGEGTSLRLKRGERITLDNLLRGIMTVSANDAAVVLAEGVAGSIDGWSQLMNDHAYRLGMVNSHFATPNGWPDEGRTFTTAQDLATLARAFIKHYPECYARYSGRKEFTYNGITKHSQDPITGVLAGADGIKTGYTRQAGFGFLGSARRKGNRLVMVIAASENSKLRGRAARRLMEWGFAAHNRVTIAPAMQPVGKARLQGGAARFVPLMADVPLTLALNPANQPDIMLTVRYSGPVKAPVYAGDVIGRFEIYQDGKLAYHYPARAAHDVAKANLFQRIINGLWALWT